MLDNGNRVIFTNKYNLHETDAIFFAKRFKNRHAQHNYKDAHSILKDHCYYDFLEEIEYLRNEKGDYYGGSYEVIDHNSRFYSPDFDCYIMTAQPYDFYKNIELIKHTLGYYGLSYVIIEELTWHGLLHDCTLYCIGSKENLINIFGKIDFDGEKHKEG